MTKETQNLCLWKSLFGESLVFASFFHVMCKSLFCRNLRHAVRILLS